MLYKLIKTYYNVLLDIVKPKITLVRIRVTIIPRQAIANVTEMETIAKALKVSTAFSLVDIS